MKSEIINKNKIDWDNVIKIDDISMPPEMVESHRQKINTIFANHNEEYRDQQLNRVILHDLLFTKAMDILSTCYEIKYDEDELQNISKMVKSNYENMDDIIATNIARKTIIRELVFEDLQKEFNITVDDNELKEVLMNYYQATNQPIRNFLNDGEQYKAAKMQILSEKTISFIISKFKFDLSELSKKIANFIANRNK